MSTQFEDALISHDGSYEISKDLLQGRTAFGGLLAAIGMRELQALAPADRVPLSLNVEFVAPVPVGTLWSTAKVLRSGKYLSQMEAMLSVSSEPAVVLQAVFGKPRDSEFEIIAKAESLSSSIDEAQRFSRIDESLPPFLQHFEFQYTESGFPFSGTGTGDLGGFCKHQNPARGYPGLVALLDAWPPTALPFYTRPVAASTVHWNIHFHHHDIAECDFSSNHYAYKARTYAANSGVATTDASLRLDGEVFASARQLVAIFD